MTLLSVGRKLWQYRVATLPIVILTLLGAIYVVAIKKPVYSASASYFLVNPPQPPSAEQIARDPKLGKGTDNPYTRFSDPSIVVQVLAAQLGSEPWRQRLAELGADRRYTVAPDVSFGFTAPIVKVTGTGTTPAGAIATANVVGRALTGQLAEMQQGRGVAPKYRITSQVLVGANEAKLKASGKLRGLVAVLALGGLLLFLVVSVLDAVSMLRRRGPAWESSDEHYDEASPGPLFLDHLPPDEASDGRDQAKGKPWHGGEYQPDEHDWGPGEVLTAAEETMEAERHD